MFTFHSIFSGIGGFDLGFERSGMACVSQTEIDKNCLGVLSRHWPNTRRYKDVKEINLEYADLICGGFPCQDLSVAGNRAGLNGKRSGLWFEFARVVGETRPRWVVVENVPGLFSSNKGEDFVIVLETLAECGYRIVWRVLDSQYFGVAQRRRRVFIVGYSGNGGELVGEAPRADQRGLARVYQRVLLESQSVCGDTAPSRETGQGVADPIATSPYADNKAQHRKLVIGFEKSRGQYTGDIAAPLQVKGGRSPGVNDGKAGNACVAFQQNTRDEVRYIGGDGSHAGALQAQAGMKQQNYVAFAPGNLTRRAGENPSAEVIGTLGAEKQGDMFLHVSGDFGVRRLTPTECERLQGFPDEWTGGQSDSVRYRQLGNAVTVPVIEWIGRRIMEVEMQCA